MHAPQKPVYALVIGIDNYKGVPKLDKAVNDARAFKELIEQKGVRVFYITNCTIKELNEIKDKFLSMIRKGDVVLVFFAGHGVTFDNHNRLLAITESEKTDYENDSLSLQALICECVTSHRVCPSPNEINVCLNNAASKVKVLNSRWSYSTAVEHLNTSQRQGMPQNYRAEQLALW